MDSIHAILIAFGSVWIIVYRIAFLGSLGSKTHHGYAFRIFVDASQIIPRIAEGAHPATSEILLSQSNRPKMKDPSLRAETLL